MKTKVVAFRVTQQEYEALLFNAATNSEKLSDFVKACLEPDIEACLDRLLKEQKRLQAKAKRDAKKAAASGVQ